jgi:hypothetical protein
MMIFRNLSQKRASQNSTTDAAIMKGEITTKRRERERDERIYFTCINSNPRKDMRKVVLNRKNKFPPT